MIHWELAPEIVAAPYAIPKTADDADQTLNSTAAGDIHRALARIADIERTAHAECSADVERALGAGARPMEAFAPDRRLSVMFRIATSPASWPTTIETSGLATVRLGICLAEWGIRERMTSFVCTRR